MRYLAPILLSLTLAACAPLGEKLATLRKESPKGDSYSQLLASEYLSYSESLAERGHPIRADRFAAKGQAALKGEKVAPEVSIKVDKQRQALLAVLNDDVKDIAPDKAALAQLLFDCMADEANSAGTAPSEKLCKESFATALSELQFIADTLVHGADNQFAVKFAPGSAELNVEADNVLGIVASRVKGLGEYGVELQANAKADAASKMQILTHQRELAIEGALIKKGVNAARIHSHYGAQGKEVVLSTDESANNGENDVRISIQTFGQPAEAKTP